MDIVKIAGEEEDFILTVTFAAGAMMVSFKNGMNESSQLRAYC